MTQRTQMIDAIEKRIAMAVLDEPWDVDTEREAAKSKDPDAACKLFSLMSSISEECYCAGWMGGLEDALWSMVKGGPRHYGMGEDVTDDHTVAEATVAAMRQLHQRCGGWWRWHDDRDEPGLTHEAWGARFVATDEWEGMVRYG